MIGEAASPEEGRPAGGSLIQVGPAASLGRMALTERDKAILDFERTWWMEAGAKDTAIRERFELSGTRYYQLLTELIDDEDALEYDPLLIRRLRRAQIARQRVQIFKPAVDTRYAADHIVSHSELRIPSERAASAAELLSLVREDTEVVGVDEGQFFDAELPAVATALDIAVPSHRGRFTAPAAAAAKALVGYRDWLETRVPQLPADIAVGRDAYVRFLREVALVPAGDPDALADEIRRLLADPETCEKMAAAAHERYVATFSTVPLSRLLDQQLRLAQLPR